MTTRQELQAAYELAFYPPRFHEIWRAVRQGSVADKPQLVQTVRTALTLLLALPNTGYASHRALRRLARYQADARAFGTPTCLRSLYRALGGPEPLPSGEMPGALVRDVGLPPFSHGEAPRKTVV